MKQIKDMTTAEWRKAWTEIAIAFENGEKVRGLWSSLCCSFEVVTDRDIQQHMIQYHKSNNSVFWFKISKAGRIRRSTFAAMFAAMTPKEFLEICEAPK